MTFLIAVDGGGRPLGEGLAGSANIVTDLAAARDNIVEAVGRAAGQAGLPEARIGEGAAVLGLAGANIGDHPARIAALLPFRVCHVVTDARIALQGALGDANGAVAVVGTGSIVIARAGGQIRTVGGWGPVVGDFCGGVRLGRTLLQETLLAHDGLREPSPLSREVLARYGGDPGVLVEYAHAAKPRDFAGFAPLLFEYADRGDAMAAGIVAEAVRHLEATLEALIGADGLPFCLLGGLASTYAKRLGPTFKSRKRRPDGNALSGALAMAVSTFGGMQEGKRIHG